MEEAIRRRRTIPESVKDELVARYLAGESPRELERELGLGRKYTHSLFRYRGIKAEGRTNRKHSLDESFFDVIDTERKAYYLGWLGADGCIFGTSVKTGVAAVDRDILEKFRADVGSSVPITDYPKTGGCRFQFHSKRMVARLAEVGIEPRKSFTHVPWPVAPDLRRHQIRGLIDGDGWMSIVGGRTCNIGLCGSLPTVEYFAQWVREQGFSPNRVRPHASIFKVMVSRSQHTAEIVRRLYEGASVYINRKKAIADQILASVWPSGPSVEWRGTMRFQFRGQNLMLREWAERLGIEMCLVRNRLRAGWPIEAALSDVKVIGAMFAVGDEAKTLPEWSKATGIPYGTIIDRLRRGLSLEAALSESKTVPIASHFLTVHGDTHTIADWSRATGISHATISMRLNRGWSDERAVTTPLLR
jgi:hypothetical protein